MKRIFLNQFEAVHVQFCCASVFRLLSDYPQEVHWFLDWKCLNF